MHAPTETLKKARCIAKKILAYARSRKDMPDEDWDDIVAECGYVEFETREIEGYQGDYIAVTEWTNGEGFDVSTVVSKHYQLFSLTYGQWDALQALVAYKE